MDEPFEARRAHAELELRASYRAIEATCIPDMPEARAAYWKKLMSGLHAQYMEQAIEEDNEPHVGVPNIDIYELYSFDRKPKPVTAPAEPKPDPQATIESEPEEEPMREYKITWSASKPPVVEARPPEEGMTFEERRLRIRQEMARPNPAPCPPSTPEDFAAKRLKVEKELAESYCRVSAGCGGGPIVGVPNIDIYKLYNCK